MIRNIFARKCTGNRTGGKMHHGSVILSNRVRKLIFAFLIDFDSVNDGI
jgi:hypothetical protein